MSELYVTWFSNAVVAMVLPAVLTAVVGILLKM